MRQVSAVEKDVAGVHLSVSEAILHVRQGRQIILVDDEERENEGDLCLAAEKVTAADINFMARFGRGLICLTLTGERIRRLGLRPMASDNRSAFGTNFHVSIEAREGVTTGISAPDRAHTIRTAVAPDATADDLVSPGHIFPLRAVDGGVLVRSGQTEGSVDLLRLAGLEPAGVICEIMKEDGTMARRADLEGLAGEHGLGILSIAQLIQYRLERERLVVPVARTRATPRGCERPFDIILYRSAIDRTEFIAFALGDLQQHKEPVLVRVQRASAMSDVFGVSPGPKGDATQRSLQMIGEAGAGVLVYLLPESSSIEADMGRLNVPAPSQGSGSQRPELREYGLGAQVLVDLGVKRIRLIGEKSARVVGLSGYGITIEDHVALE